MWRPGTDRKYPYILLVAAGAILAIGLVLKPNQPEQKSQPSETELAQLQRLTQQRRLQDLSSYLTDAAQLAASSLVLVEPGGNSGVLWDSQTPFVTTSRPPDNEQASTTATADGRSLPLQKVPLQHGTPVTVYSLPQTPPIRAATVAAKTPDLGAWVLAVAKNAKGRVVFAHGIYQGIGESRCGSFAYRSVQSSAAVSAALLGGGMFTLDGQLLGIVAECEQKIIIVAAESVAELLRQPPSMETRLEDYYGIKVSDETMPAGAHLGNAVQIVSIWTRSRGEEAGLRPGDVITAADGQPVVTSGDLEAVLTGGTSEHQLTIQRGRQSLVIALPANSLPPSAPASYGMTLDQGSSNRRVTILAVAANSSAQHAGILGGDVLLQVGTMPVTDTAAARRALQDAKATRVLTLEREGRQYEVLIKP